jgi:hypothetical protein
LTTRYWQLDKIPFESPIISGNRVRDNFMYEINNNHIYLPCSMQKDGRMKSTICIVQKEGESQHIRSSKNIRTQEISL